MAGDWIKVRTNLHDEPEVIALAAELALDNDVIVGKLVRFWSWADEHLKDGRASGATESWLDRYTACAGFAQALQKVGWLSLKRDGFSVPNFDRHMGKSAKNRANNTIRARKSRRATSATKALAEKRREEKRREDINTPLPPTGGNGLPDIPTELSTPEFRTAWDSWIRYRRERKLGFVRSTAERLLKKFQAWGVAKAIAAIEQSIANGWQGVFDPESGMANSFPRPNGKPQSEFQRLIEERKQQELVSNGKP